MSNKKTSQFQSAAAGALLTVMASSPFAQENETQNDVSYEEQASATIIMSENTARTYQKLATYAGDFAPGLTAILLTKNDFDIQVTEDELNAFALHSTCEPFPQTHDAITASKKIEETSDTVLEFIKSLAEQENAIIDKNVLQNAIYQNPSDFSSTLMSAAYTAQTETAASISFKSLFPNDDLNFAIITMPEKIESVEKQIQGISGLPAKYINNINSTATDLTIFTLGHEIAGHAHHEHNGSTHNAELNCVEINTAWLDNTSISESVGDVMGSYTFQYAQQDGATSDADTPTEWAALRSLGSLYLGGNAISATNTQHANSHITTLIFDPESEDYLSTNDMGYAEHVSEVHLLINNVADTISGFVATQDFKKEMATQPDLYSQDQHEYFGSLPDTPENILNYMADFSSQGLNKRIGIAAANEYETAIEGDPQWHYAAIAYIAKHDILANLKNDIAPEYAAAMDDLITDFLNAAEQHGKQLINSEISVKIEKALPPQSFDFLNLDTIYGFQPEITEEDVISTPMM